MTNRWKSSFKINLKFWQKVEILMGNKAYIYLLIASFFRFSAGYALGIWSKSYFSNVYPEHQDDFAVAYFFILIFGSVPSELIGGYIGDTYE
jgi:sugar phosphate permease